MASAAEGDGPSPLSPDAAFSVLGNEIRIQILQTLGEADGPLTFTEIRNLIGLKRGGQFNYHLDQLVGHFVIKSNAGYELRAPGRRVVKAVLSGSVAESPATEREEINQACQLCGAPIEVRYHEEAVETFCTECSGMWGSHETIEDGYLGRRLLPPAGVEDRSSEAMYRASWTWTNLDFFAMASGLCPACSATVDTSVDVCDDHKPENGRCPACENRSAARLLVKCTNCILDLSGSLPIVVANETALLDFLTDHGLNPVAPDSIAPVQRFFSDYDEEIESAEPFRAELTFDVEGDSITLTVDNTLSVVDIDRTD